MTTETISQLEFIPEGANRTNAERVLAVMGKQAKTPEAIVESIAKRYKNADNHLSVIQVKGALKFLTTGPEGGTPLVMSENVKTGVKGRPPKAYRLFVESSASGEGSSDAATT